MKAIQLSLILAMFVVIACQNQNNNQEDADDHNHDNVSVRFTQYDSEYEIFAEFTPLSMGHTSGILAHITKLSTFKPLKKGKATAELVIGSNGIRQRLEQPARPGIFLFEIQPEVAGKGKLTLIFETEKGKSTFVTGVEVFTDEHEAIHAAEENVHNHPNAISFTKEQSWKVDFATGYPAIEPFGEIIKTTARVQSVPSEEVIISAKANGIVQFSNNTLTEGASVSKGKVLFSISAESLADNNMNVRYNEAKNNYEKAEADFKRKSELAKDKLVSQKELLDSKAEYENSKLRFKNLSKNFNESGQKVLSTKGGFIKHIYITNGQYVEAGQPLVSITENKNLFLKAEVQQKYAAALPFIKTANIRSLNSNIVFSLEELNGKVVSYAKNVSDESYLIPVTLQIENRAEIVPGSFMELFLRTESDTEVLTIPNEALIEEQGNFAVFVQLTPESFEKREIKIGKTDGSKTEVISGLMSAERIVTKGGMLVKLAAVTNSLDPHAGHVH